MEAVEVAVEIGGRFGKRRYRRQGLVGYGYEKGKQGLIGLELVELGGELLGY